MVSVTKVSLPSNWTSEAAWKDIGSSWGNFNGVDIYTVIAEETFSISDSRWRRVKKFFSEAIGITAAYWDNISFTMRFLESVGINEWCGRNCFKNKESSFTISDGDHITKVVDKTIPVLITIDLVVTDIRTITRDLTETIGISSVFCKEPIKIKYSSFGICDDMLRNCNAVIADIIFSDKEIDNSVPAGYSPWEPFISGDYTYKDALIKAEIKSKDKGTLSEYTVYVDLPDIKDTGRNKVEAQNTWVPFVQEFYQVPEVTISMVGSTTFVMPVIVEVRLDGFFVCLKDRDGNNVAGTIAWQALGC